jgi:hypothetical protein
MKTLQQFIDSLQSDKPGAELSIPLRALWYDGKGDWSTAHSQVDHRSDPASSLIHAYLHRKEGDLWNADYWYRKARQSRPDVSLHDEWKLLVQRFLN